MGRDRFRGEKHVAEIGGEALVPIFGRDGFERVAVVAGGVVDEDGDVADFGVGLVDGGLELRDVADVALEEVRSVVCVGGNFFGEELAWFGGDVEEGDFGVLAGECFGEGGANAAAAAGDEDGFAGEVGVGAARGRRWRFFGGGHCVVGYRFLCRAWAVNGYCSDSALQRKGLGESWK